MATKPNLRDHVSLLFELYNRIPQTHSITAQELQQQLSSIGVERDIRTIQRNLDILVQHLNVAKDTRDRPYGYRREASMLNSFGARETILLAFAEQWLTNTFPVEYRAILHSLFSDVLQQKSQKHDTVSLQDLVYVNESLIPSISYTPIFSSAFELICKAMVDTNQLKVELPDGQHTIEPLGLVIIGQGLSVIYHEPKNHQVKHADVSNITSAHLSTFDFKRPKEFSIKAYVKQIPTIPTEPQS
ncbi:hypothetical protein H5300_21415 [Vibrio sp. SG41-7]|uniref:helix-turn-helix transcriptional regulator n=1 Tax=Vibrio sp. SG41-7 TaxID=2760973 RepID=UPI0015FF1097|nr:hypothetical protein [Vibrio sp. SG41-7]MBB1465832.1 hypothetical protein [Vibrio sp. SG41-7]